MSVMDRVKSLLGSDDPTPQAGASAAPQVEPPLEISLSDPGPDTDTCKIVLNRELSRGKTEFFETHVEAEGWPMIQSLMRISGVHSVIVKGNLLIVSKHSGAQWSQLLQPLETAIRNGLEPADENGLSAVDAIANAAAGSGQDQDLRDRVQEIIDNEINPSVAAHGGYISLLDVQGTRVFLHMGGGCQGCEMASATLKHGVESTLRSQLPEISEIFDTTDHAAGENPFYQSGF